MTLDWLGWSSLTPNEQLGVIFYGVIFGAAGLGVYLAVLSLFGWAVRKLPKRTPARKKRRRKKAKKKGRR